MERPTIEACCSTLESRLSGVTNQDLMLANAIAYLSEIFRLEAHEIAILDLDAQKNILRFVAPHQLKKVGFIPLSSHDSLAARTAREQEVFIENDFSGKRHANFFEKFRLEVMEPDAPDPIQKIMSSPILTEEASRGVIQLSRKGKKGKPVDRPDFTPADAELIVALGRVLATHL